MTRAETTAARGAAWLDKVHPEWWTKVNLFTLDLANSCRCVLGQVVGTRHEQSGYRAVYYTFADLLLPEEKDRWFTDHGFLPPRPFGNFELEEAWITEIKARAETGNIT